jgi:hypothetical protein
VFVLNGEYRTIRPEFHHIALADQAQSVRPDRQGIFHACAIATGDVRGTINLCVLGIAARGVDVVGELTLHVDQAAAARTIGPMVESGKRYGLSIVHGWRSEVLFGNE